MDTAINVALRKYCVKYRALVPDTTLCRENNLPKRSGANA